MKHLRLIVAAIFFATTAVFALACDKTSTEEAEKEAEMMEKAKEKANVKPSGTKEEAKDTPIEGPPEQIFSEIRREVDAYQNKIYSSPKDIPQDLRTKIDSIEARVEQLDNSLSVDELEGEEIDKELSSRIAQLKKEWNQTKRQVDVALGTTQSETDEKGK